MVTLPKSFLMVRPKKKYMEEAIRLARINMEQDHGGPFGCVIVKDGEIIASAHNEVLSTNDPTAHAEIVAIRRACDRLGHHQLSGCDIYTSCEPCPMCLGAIYWCRPDRVFFAATQQDAAQAGFDDAYIYREMCTPLTQRDIPFIQFMQQPVQEIFLHWSNNNTPKY
jgi:tRNA(Arg) A34 adenosine deaminase TadA